MGNAKIVAGIATTAIVAGVTIGLITGKIKRPPVPASAPMPETYCVVRAPCFEREADLLRRRVAAETGVARVSTQADLDKLLLGRKMLPAAWERRINGRCYYLLPESQAAGVERAGLARPIIDDVSDLYQGVPK